MKRWLSHTRYRRNRAIANVLGCIIETLIRAMPDGHAGRYSLLPKYRRYRNPKR
jgi:hypothetical protein